MRVIRLASLHVVAPLPRAGGGSGSERYVGRWMHLAPELRACCVTTIGGRRYAEGSGERSLNLWAK